MHMLLKLLPALFALSLAGAQELTVLKDATKEYVLGPRMALFEDPGRALTIHDVAAGEASHQFSQAKTTVPNFSSTHAAVWVRFSIVDSTNEYGVWLLEAGYPLLEEVDLYAGSPDTGFQKTVSLSSTPIENREIRHRFHYFHLVLRKNVPQQYYVRITSRTSIPVALTVRHVREFMDFDHRTQIVLGVFYGALMIMVLYNLFLFISIRDRTYLYYVLYVTSYSFYQLGLDGVSKEYIFTSGRDFFYVTYAGIGAFLFFGVLFTREYLGTKMKLKVLDRPLQAIGMLAFICLVLSPLIAGGTMNLVAGALGIGYIVAGLTAAVVRRRQGFRPATYYLIALTGFFIGFLFRILRVEGLVPMNFFTQNSFQIGILWEVTMLSLALGNRINTLKAEHARERELTRHRISSDLHDEIGSSLSSIAVSSHMIKEGSRLTRVGRQQLDDIVIAARETTEAMRDIVWFVNPDHDSPAEMTAKMKETASSLLHDHQVRFDIDEKAIEHILELQVRRNIFLIFKESLNNIVLHAKATIVDLSMQKKGDTVVLCIKDNGAGFDPLRVREGNGLRNIRNRARQMDAELDIKSTPKRGTRLCLVYRIP